ncbi:MAG: hypothetical protein F4X97_10200 [Boseongicola sp. SB0662_bin_57]|nr:hypothetical protein [Boseongicola sp. SB0662_bin_57]
MTYELFKDFQSALVGVVGFIGVILTLVGNAWLTRRQHRFEQDQLRLMVEAGLREELRAFLEMAERNVQSLGNWDSDRNLNVPRIRPLVSERLIQDLGLLEADKAQAALKGVMTVREMHRKLTLLARCVSEEYITIEGKNHELVKAAYGSVLCNLRRAVDALEP